MKRRWISLLLTGTLAVGTYSLEDVETSGSEEADNTFSYWLITTDGDGVYYDDYEDHPSTQWLNQQYWDVENHTKGDADNGTNIKFTFQTPIAGSETDNFNTMIGTGEYTDIMDLTYPTVYRKYGSRRNSDGYYRVRGKIYAGLRGDAGRPSGVESAGNNHG